jgi:hypothetical protein
MNLLLAFSPFLAFVVVEATVGVTAGLAAAALISVAMLLRDFVSRERRVKILEVGTLLLFGALACYAYAFGASWSVPAVRLRVDAGLLLIVLASIALRQPFTMQYARERIAAERWHAPAFLRVNDVITSAWAAAFAAMVAADLLMAYVPTVPRWIGVAITVAALGAAVRFTGWYARRSERVRPN